MLQNGLSEEVRKYIFINNIHNYWLFKSFNNIFKFLDCRVLSTLPEKAEEVEVATVTKKEKHIRTRGSRNSPLENRFVYPEFLPDPNPNWRNSLREKLERADMLKRRNQIDIPEFYVGKFAFY